jgi:CheY-like chemotaxis protein
MLVDDNADAAQTMGELLRAQGHEIHVFHDPVSALQSAGAIGPEFAVLDIGLPVMNGYELGTKIREICGSACRLIALTGYGQDTDKERSRAAGFHAHVIKPVNVDQLLELFESDTGRS